MGHTGQAEKTEHEALVALDDKTTELLVENHKKFRRFLAKRLNNESLAEDLLQQSLKKAIESPPNSNKELSVLAWFYRILRNTLIDHYRASASEQKKVTELTERTTLLEQDFTKALDDLEAQVCECMEDLLPALKSNYAEVLRRVDLQSEPIEKVASDLGVTLNNLSVRLHRARHALRVSLERACGTCTEHGCLNCTCE